MRPRQPEGRPATDVTHTVTVGKPPASIALTAPEDASMSGGIEITGTFTAQGKALPERAVLKVVREDRLGAGTLSSVTVAADGTFMCPEGARGCIGVRLPRVGATSPTRPAQAHSREPQRR
ncbi:hypothetical protein [Streptomyces africanus]|uniref:hypothetical protein n=1 Tax=Streptomyces africanus TaxID=231024 RepID=UPI0027D792AC|nr:hypothetical protein [Streptomyces africanus]